jgi:hypothetical protein
MRPPAPKTPGEVRIGLFQHALAHPEANSERFEGIEAKLDKLRSYLYANRESIMGYAAIYPPTFGRSKLRRKFRT